jgi:plasmid stabilization system protein ParE
MAQVRWSLTAGNDLQDIEDFIALRRMVHGEATPIKSIQMDVFAYR